GGFIGLGGIPTLEFADEPAIFHLMAWAFVVVSLVIYANIMASAAGRALNTLRNDELRAEADGDRGPHRLAALFAISAGMCGAAGWLYAHYLTYLAPESLAPLLSITVLLMVIVGGSRYVLGPVVGAAALTYLNDWLPDEIQGMLYGGALVLVLLIAPKGILGVLEALRDRASGSRTQVTSAESVSDELLDEEKVVAR